MEQKVIKIADLETNRGQIDGLPKNPRTIKDARFKALKKSIEDAPEMLNLRELLVYPHNGKFVVIGGNMRLRACKELGYKELPCKVIDENTPVEKLREYTIKDNIGFGADDWGALFEDWNTDELADWGLEFPEDLSGEDVNAPQKANKLQDEFLVPPLSILDATKDYWQKRKKCWLALGLQSDKGRDDKMLKSMNSLIKKSDMGGGNDESIFDPCLCEILYSWFSPKDGNVFDPFCGGSVRGVVASFCNMNYLGLDIREEQITANEEQIRLCQSHKPQWICCDSTLMNDVIPQNYKADFVFSCPPYADLEVYSDLNGDLSNMHYDDFLRAYFDIIQKSCNILNDNRFACFVVGEVRDRKGVYYNFVSDTIRAFQKAGLSFYNEIILKTPISAKALTCGIAMRKSRKIGKVHQNILVFIKGDAKKAVAEIGDIEFSEIIS